MRKQQSFSTRYRWSAPAPESKPIDGAPKDGADHYFVHGDGGRSYIPKSLVAWALEHGAKIIVESLPADYEKDLLKMEGVLRRKIGPSECVCLLNGTDPILLIETPTALGVREHKERRAIAERFFRKWGLTFTVECATLHSDHFCSLLPARVLDEQPEEPRPVPSPGDGG